MFKPIFFAALAGAALLASSAAPAFADDDDDDDRGHRRGGYSHGISRGEAMDIARRTGIVRFEEIERDDGGWEIEGRTRSGREREIEISRGGRVDRDDDDDDDDWGEED